MKSIQVEYVVDDKVTTKDGQSGTIGGILVSKDCTLYRVDTGGAKFWKRADELKPE
jgi:hypothetical protein